jgi:uncharacterized protein YdiU (UPF0061 family)
MQWAAAHEDPALPRALADYTIARHYPELADAPDPYQALFDAIVDRQARLIVRWQMVGFIHGVMNTDNMALSGETIDYGPCAFMDAWDPATVFSSIDQGGRYAYGNQPPIAAWNLARLAEAMLPLFGDDADRAVEQATAAVGRFRETFEQLWLDGMRAKLGLFAAEDGDATLVEDLLAWMRERSADFTNTFAALTAGRRPVDEPDAEFEAWRERWQARRRRQTQAPAEADALMRRHNPALVPRNHLVEAALEAATVRSDVAPLERLLAALSAPYHHERDVSEFTDPGTWSQPYRTFCGT